MTILRKLERTRTDAATLNRQSQRPQLRKAIDAFRSGGPVLIYDAEGRENETDLVYPARSVSTQEITRLRNDAGGLICVALGHTAATAFDLPYMQEALSHPCTESNELQYDERSSFSISVNHRETRTGIPDTERAKTISSIGYAAESPTEVDFSEEFRAPGHVPLLKAAPGLVSDRQGHTELAITLTKLADTAPAAVVCEMLDDESGEALSKSDAQTYARMNGIPFIDGTMILNAV